MHNDGCPAGAHIKTLEGYIDFLSVVVACAPANFIYRDYLKEEEQLNFERAFRILREKFHLAETRVIDKTVLPQIRALIEAAYDAYRRGDDIKGAHTIQDFEGQILAAAKPRIT